MHCACTWTECTARGLNVLEFIHHNSETCHEVKAVTVVTQPRRREE